jgi:hypothetical protein
MAESKSSKSTSSGAATVTGEDTTTQHQTAATGTAPVGAGRFQPGEEVSAPLTTNPPRGLNEAPSNLLADEPGARALQEAVRDVVVAETEAGFRGYNTDPTPNEAYTLKGVGEGQPNPETTVVTPKGVEPGH